LICRVQKDPAPGSLPAQAAEIGAAQLPHSAGIPLAIAKNP